MSAAPRGSATNRLRERRIMLIVWTASVAIVMWLGIGFGGGLDKAFSDWPSWMIAASPPIPLILWLRARRDVRPDPGPPA